MLPRNLRGALALLLCAWMALPCAAHAAEFKPSRPVRLVVPLTPGGTADVMGRVMAQALGQYWGQPVLVENRPGAGGHLGAELVARSPGDGHVLLFSTIGIHAAYTMYRKLGYDPATDLAPGVLLADMPFVVVARIELPQRSLAELVAAARARPGSITYGSAGSGTSTHLAGELFQLLSGGRLTHVPYRGSSQVANDLAAGNVDLLFDNLPTVPGMLAGGRVRGLAVTSRERNAAVPAVPTSIEAGLPEFIASAWFGLSLPGSTPEPLLLALNADMRATLAEPAVRDRLVALGTTPMGGTIPEIRAFFAAEREKWGRVIAAARLEVE